MKIDDAVLNHKKVEFRHVECGDVFSLDEEFYIKCNLNPHIFAMCCGKGNKINENNAEEFGYAANIYDGFVNIFEQTLMVYPIKAKITLDK